MRASVFLGGVVVPFVLAVAIDQLSKGYAQNALAGAPPSTIARGIIRLHYVENSAGFLGVLIAIPEPFRQLLLTAGVAILLLIGCLLLFRFSPLSLPQLISSSLILAGGTGNLIDRLSNNGGVIDFIAIEMGPLSTGIFNFADLCILCGGFYLGYSLTRALPTSR